MGLWEKWLVKKICKQALKDYKSKKEAAQASLNRINTELLPSRTSPDRIHRIYGYLLDIWEDITGSKFPHKDVGKDYE